MRRQDMLIPGTNDARRAQDAGVLRISRRMKRSSVAPARTKRLPGAGEAPPENDGEEKETKKRERKRRDKKRRDK